MTPPYELRGHAPQLLGYAHRLQRILRVTGRLSGSGVSVNRESCEVLRLSSYKQRRRSSSSELDGHRRSEKLKDRSTKSTIDALNRWAGTRLDRSQRNPLLILGPFGTGKSVSLESFAWRAAASLERWALEDEDSIPAVPLPVRLRSLRFDLGEHERFIDFMARSCQLLDPNDSSGILDRRLIELCLDCGALVPLFDGLDELPGDTEYGHVRRMAVDAMLSACAGYVAVTCRPGYDGEYLFGGLADVATVAPLDEHETRGFVCRRLNIPEAVDHPALMALRRMEGQLRAVLDRPLLLTVWCNKLTAVPADMTRDYDGLMAELYVGCFDSRRKILPVGLVERLSVRRMLGALLKVFADTRFTTLSHDQLIVRLGQEPSSAEQDWDRAILLAVEMGFLELAGLTMYRSSKTPICEYLAGRYLAGLLDEGVDGRRHALDTLRRWVWQPELRDNLDQVVLCCTANPHRRTIAVAFIDWLVEVSRCSWGVVHSSACVSDDMMRPKAWTALRLSRLLGTGQSEQQPVISAIAEIALHREVLCPGFVPNSFGLNALDLYDTAELSTELSYELIHAIVAQLAMCYRRKQSRAATNDSSLPMDVCRHEALTFLSDLAERVAPADSIRLIRAWAVGPVPDESKPICIQCLASVAFRAASRPGLCDIPDEDIIDLIRTCAKYNQKGVWDRRAPAIWRLVMERNNRLTSWNTLDCIIRIMLPELLAHNSRFCKNIVVALAERTLIDPTEHDVDTFLAKGRAANDRAERELWMAAIEIMAQSFGRKNIGFELALVLHCISDWPGAEEALSNTCLADLSRSVAASLLDDDQAEEWDINRVLKAFEAVLELHRSTDPKHRMCEIIAHAAARSEKLSGDARFRRYVNMGHKEPEPSVDLDPALLEWPRDGEGCPVKPEEVDEYIERVQAAHVQHKQMEWSEERDRWDFPLAPYPGPWSAIIALAERVPSDVALESMRQWYKKLIGGSLLREPWLRAMEGAAKAVPYKQRVEALGLLFSTGCWTVTMRELIMQFQPDVVVTVTSDLCNRLCFIQREHADLFLDPSLTCAPPLIREVLCRSKELENATVGHARVAAGKEHPENSEVVPAHDACLLDMVKQAIDRVEPGRADMERQYPADVLHPDDNTKLEVVRSLLVAWKSKLGKKFEPRHGRDLDNAFVRSSELSNKSAGQRPYYRLVRALGILEGVSRTPDSNMASSLLDKHKDKLPVLMKILDPDYGKRLLMAPQDRRRSAEPSSGRGIRTQNDVESLPPIPNTVWKGFNAACEALARMDERRRQSAAKPRPD